jgi:hypothetical protein
MHCVRYADIHSDLARTLRSLRPQGIDAFLTQPSHAAAKGTHGPWNVPANRLHTIRDIFFSGTGQSFVSRDGVNVLAGAW